jgi:hypothetical protein
MAVCDTDECRILVPWRSTNTGCLEQNVDHHSGLFFELDPDTGDVEKMAWFGVSAAYIPCRELVLSNEVDPTLQTTANDVVIAPGDVFCMGGVVRFGRAGATIAFKLQSYDALEPDDIAGGSCSIQFFATPGAEITPAGGCPTLHMGVIARNECDNAVMIGCSEPPNSSHGGTSRNNGGYAGLPGPLEFELGFSFCFDLNGPQMRVTYGGDFGEGYMETLKYVNDTTHSGGPVYCPGGVTDAGVCSHAGHKLILSVLPGGNSVSTDPSVILTGLTASYGCVLNPDYVDPTNDQV